MVSTHSKIFTGLAAIALALAPALPSTAVTFTTTGTTTGAPMWNRPIAVLGDLFCSLNKA